jgi:hypothetical protein
MVFDRNVPRKNFTSGASSLSICSQPIRLKAEINETGGDAAMKYLCQVWMEDGMVDAMSVEDKKKLDRDSLAYDEVLVERGQLIAAEALQSPRSAVTVRVRDGEILTTDGPYAETKEQLGGFILIDAKDMNDAIRIAAGIPLAKLCSVEVRPIYDFSTEQ